MGWSETETPHEIWGPKFEAILAPTRINGNQPMLLTPSRRELRITKRSEEKEERSNSNLSIGGLSESGGPIARDSSSRFLSLLIQPLPFSSSSSLSSPILFFPYFLFSFPSYATMGLKTYKRRPKNRHTASQPIGLMGQPIRPINSGMTDPLDRPTNNEPISSTIPTF